MPLASNATGTQDNQRTARLVSYAAKAKAQASHAIKQVMYASDMQQWNKVPLIGFGVAGYQGSFIIRSRNGAIEQATQANGKNV